jgi:predicted acyltransferase
MDAINPSPPRLASLDQFRGYTVLGMFLVNFVGGLAAVPAILKHHQQ